MDPDVASFIQVFAALVGIPGAIFLLYPISRAIARAIGGATESPALKAELEELRARLAELEDLQARVVTGETAARRIAELEERLDFTERMLARQKPAAQLKPGED